VARLEAQMDVERKDHWQRVYSEKAESEVSWFQQHPALSLELIKSAHLPPDARIIDVGGGASRLVDHLLAAEYRNLTVLDVAEEALAQAQRRLGPAVSVVDWVVADITRWRPDVAYDVWHDRAVFHFLVEPEERAAYLRTLRRAVRSGGAVVIGTFALEGPERCSGLPVVRYSPQSLTRELGEGFELLESATEAHQTPSGKIQHFQFSRFRLNKCFA
jgi:ubiquinone/menaquinone biosynthesis C-methylase UbiE